MSTPAKESVTVGGCRIERVALPLPVGFIFDAFQGVLK